MSPGEEGKLKPGVAPAGEHSKSESIVHETDHQASCPYYNGLLEKVKKNPGHEFDE